MTRSCCVVNCTNRSGNGMRFFNIPRKKNAFAQHRRKLWLQAIKRADWGKDGPQGEASVCSAHFISGEPSMVHDSPDFVPSIFPYNHKRITKGTAAASRFARKKRREDRRAPNDRPTVMPDQEACAEKNPPEKPIEQQYRELLEDYSVLKKEPEALQEENCRLKDQLKKSRFGEMAESDLFMECEEEELEPWQQVQENIEGMVMEPVKSISTVNQVTPVESVVTPPRVPVTIPVPVVSTHLVLPSQALSVNSSSSNNSALPLLTNTSSLLSSMGSVSVPAALPAGLPKASPGQQLILAPGAGGLGTVALSQLLLPASAQGLGTATNQPIFITTQGLPVQNFAAGQNPLGFVLNVQQGQTIKPITLLSAPTAFKSAVGGAQIINQPAALRAQVGTVNPPAAPTHTTTFTRVQIPATLTIRSTAPISQPRPTMVSMSGPLTSTSVKTTTTHLTNTDTSSFNKAKPVEGSTDLPKLLNVVSQPQTLIVVSSQKTNGLPSNCTPVTQSTMQATSNSSPPSIKVCPRCGAQFKMIEALRGHMCFCCPDLTQSPTTSKVSPVKSPAVQEAATPPVQRQAEGGDPPEKLVMYVDDFYYGAYEGNRANAAQDNLKDPLTFKCLTCGKKLRNNIRLMNHMKHHVELEHQSGEMDTHTSCQHCYRQFPTPFRLQCHVESVHSSYESNTKCKICEWAFETEPVFLQHMKNTHKPGEMPYVCQVCEYRSSFYSDVYNHFRTWHEDTRHLLCLYCLKVFKNAISYQQHFSRHQKSTVYHCNKCRLQFLFTKEKLDHKVSHHKTFRKPRQLEGVLAGTKVTIRAHSQNKPRNTTSGNSPAASSAPPRPETAPVSTPQSQPRAASEHRPIVLHSRATVAKKPISRMIELLTKFQEQRPFLGKQKCIECNHEVPDFSHHYPTYVHCSLCRYSTCCSRAYANHMISNHVTRKNTKFKGIAQPPPSMLKMVCADCCFFTCNGDLMAKHLVQNPGHGYSTCSAKDYLESDIEFSVVEEEEEEELRSEGTSDVGKEPDWASVDALVEGQSSAPIPEFTDSSGPCHSLGENSEAIEYFQLLFPNSLMELITAETNSFAKFCRFVGQGDPDWIPMTVAELKAFFGLCIYMGLWNLPETQLYWTFEHNKRCGFFVKTMTFKRFQQISFHVRMGNWVTTREEGSGKDRLELFQPMLNILKVSMWEAYKPNKNLSIDRALLPHLETEVGKERRPRETQPRVWLLCDSKTGYCHRLHIQTHCKRDREVASVVPALVEGIEGKHHHIYLSKSLASIPIMQELLVQQIFASASVLPQPPIVPKALKDRDHVETPGDFRQYTCGTVMLTRWKDTKEMFCMSTNCLTGRPDDVWRRSQVRAGELVSMKRPQAFKLLQDNMRGVDICNQLLTCNLLGGVVLDTHWRCLFWFIVNLSIINSFIVLRESRRHNPPTWVKDGRFAQAQYRKRLAYQLIKHTYKVHERFPNYLIKPQPTGLSLKFVRTHKDDSEGVRHYLGIVTSKTRRCKNCTQWGLRHESRYGCCVCMVNLCKTGSCFWEFHGLSAHGKGPPTVGYVERGQKSSDMRNKASGSISESLEDPSMVERGLDQAMAPLEDSDVEQMDADQVQEAEEEPAETNRNSGQDISEETHTEITPTHESPKLELEALAKEPEETQSNLSKDFPVCATDHPKVLPQSQN